MNFQHANQQTKATEKRKALMALACLAASTLLAGQAFANDVAIPVPEEILVAVPVELPEAMIPVPEFVDRPRLVPLPSAPTPSPTPLPAPCCGTIDRPPQEIDRPETQNPGGEEGTGTAEGGSATLEDPAGFDFSGGGCGLAHAPAGNLLDALILALPFAYFFTKKRKLFEKQ